MRFRDEPPLNCFIISPFAKEFTPVCEALKQVMVEKFGGIAERGDDRRAPGEILGQIKEQIHRADFCIADVSRSKAVKSVSTNANVMWEAGYAHALERPIVQISQGTEHLPFDIRAMRTVLYSLDRLDRLKGEVAEAIREVVDELRHLPRVLGEPYNEFGTLWARLERRNVHDDNEDGFLSVLPILLKALKKERLVASKSDWLSDEAERLMTAVARVHPDEATNVFWWLIVHGILVYPGIDGPFQAYSKRNGPLDDWDENIHLVTISERGCRFLNQAKPPL